MRHDLTLVALELFKDGALEPGIYSTYDGTQLHGSPFPIHTKAHKGFLIVTYQCQYRDRRLRVELVENFTSYRFTCPKCEQTREWLRLTDEGDFVCEDCMPFSVTPTTRTMQKKRKPRWERMQARTLEIRKELRNYTDDPRTLKWPGRFTTKARWNALVQELMDLEPRMIATYLAYTRKHIDTITGIQGPLSSCPTKSPPEAGIGSSDED